MDLLLLHACNLLPADIVDTPIPSAFVILICIRLLLTLTYVCLLAPTVPLRTYCSSFVFIFAYFPCVFSLGRSK